MSSKKVFDYKWVIVGVSAFMVFVVLGFFGSTKGLFIKAVTEALSIPRSTYSFNDSLRFITTAIVNVFFGTLVMRFGAKKLIAAGFCCLIASSVLYSVATNVFTIYAGGILLGVGSSWTTTTIVGYIVNQWCKEKKGTIMGFILASNGIGIAIATQILSPIINESVFSYRNAYRIIAAILASAFVIIMLLLKNKTTTVESEPVKDEHKGHKESYSGSKLYYFSILLCIFFTGMTLQGVCGISTPLLYDVGIDKTFVATAIGVHSIALTIFKFLTGYIYDKFGIRFTSNMCLCASIVSFISLICASNGVLGNESTMVYQILSSLALPLETIMLPLYAGEFFDKKIYGKALGIFVSFNTAGYAVGAPLSNVCYDIYGNYNISLYAGLGLIIFVMICMNFIITASNHRHKELDN